MLIANFITIIVLLVFMKATGCFKFMKEVFNNNNEDK